MEDKNKMGRTVSTSAQNQPQGPQDKSAYVGRFYNPPTLERKESSGDLHSRLKTRKMLGVGETDNGDIHRSKISQVLGHNEHLYLRLPRGYWNWHLFLTGFLALQGTLILVLPSKAEDFGLFCLESSHSGTHHQYYAATMLALAWVFWRFLDTNDKAVARTIQTAALIYFASLISLDILFILTNGITLLFQKSVILMSGMRISMIFICISYLKAMGRATSGLRRSPSYKESSQQQDNNTPRSKENNKNQNN